MKTKKEEKMARSPASPEKKGQTSEHKRAEEALQNSESFLNNIIEQSPSPMWISDAHGTLIRLNQALRALLNISDEDVVGKYNVFKDNIVEEQGFLPLVRRVFEEGETARFELRYDSSQLQHLQLQHFAFVILDVSIFPIRDVSGRITNAVIQHMDITERKRADEALRQSEDKYRSIVEQSIMGIGISKGNQVIFANDALLKLFKYDDLEEFKKITLLDLAAPSSKKLIIDRMKMVGEGKKLPSEFVYDIICKGGQIRTLHASSTHLSLEGEVFTQTTFQDITERKRAEEGLRKSEEKFRNLFDNAIEGVFQTTPEGRLITVNRAFARMFGYESPGEVINTVTDIASQMYENPDDRKIIVGILKGRGYLKNYECQMRQKDGSIFWGSLNARLTETIDGTPCFEGFIIDITERKQIEKALYTSEERYRDLVENSQDLICTHDLEGNLLSVNEAPVKALGYSSELLLHTNMSNFLAPELCDQFGAYLKEIQEKGCASGILRIQTTSGETRYWEYNNTLRTEGVAVPIVRGIAHDITERMKAELALRESEKKYRDLYDFLPIPVYEMDFEANITSANRAIYETFRGTEEDLKKRLKAWQLLSPEEVESSAKDIQRLLNGEQIEGTEYTFKRLDGSVFPAMVISSVIYSNDKPVGLRGAVVDITERKQAEEKLRESNERYKALFDGSLDLVYITDFEGRFIDANNAALNRLGYMREEIRSLNFASLLSEDQLPLALKTLQDVREFGTQMSLMEFKLRHKNGSEVYVETRGSAIMSKGTPVAFQAIARDITERKKAEEKLSQTLENLRKAMGGIIQVLSGTVETRDPYTAGHQRRVADLARAIAQEMGLPDDQRDGLRMAGTIHDVGKVSVPAEILIKPTKLTEIEYKLIQAHSQIGYDILKGIEFPWPIAEMVLQHHERMNGSGYPQGLKGEAISQEARILMVADVVEAMASYRPYRPALGVEPALEEIEKNKGILYDPEVVEVCLRLFREKGFGFE